MRLYISLIPPKHVVASGRRWLAISGITCLIAVVIGGSLQLGDITLPPIASTSRQVALAIIGAVLFISSFVTVEHAGSTHAAGVLGDSDFWLKIFNAMPPAFIKEYPVDTHLIDNQALRIFQGDKTPVPSDATELHTLINADHRQGDSIAAETGGSVQLEFSDQCSTKHPQLILTFKRRVEHAKRTFIVGWYVPIERPIALGKEITEIKKRGEQVMFQISECASDGGDNFLINIGRSARRAELHRHGTGRLRRRF
jgi:hypothetical protein